MLKLGVIGFPVGHSLSPRMHSAALRALAIDGAYDAIAVKPEQLTETVQSLFADGYDGLNATIPHKQAVLPLMDELADSARAIGAVNTIVKQNGRLIGHNTDAAGFMRGLTEAGFRASGANVLVLGAGGAARAVVYGLKQAGATLTIWNRTNDRAQSLASEFGATVASQLPEANLDRFDLVVNTTSLGMTPHTEISPLSFAKSAPRWMYDLVYRPRETRLLREAGIARARTIGGIEMLVYQGAEGFRLWTGRDAPIAVMREAVTRSQ